MTMDEKAPKLGLQCGKNGENHPKAARKVVSSIMKLFLEKF